MFGRSSNLPLLLLNTTRAARRTLSRVPLVELASLASPRLADPDADALGRARLLFLARTAHLLARRRENLRRAGDPGVGARSTGRRPQLARNAQGDAEEIRRL